MRWRLCVLPAERQSSLGHAPHEDPQSHYDLPVNSHIPGHYDLPPVRRPPSPRRTPQWRSQQRSRSPSSSPTDSPQARRERRRANFLLLSDDQSHGPPTKQWWGAGPTKAPQSTQHCPSVCRSGTRLTVTDLPSRTGSQQFCGEEGRTVATPAALQLPSSPTGKTRHKTLKAATCVWTQLAADQLFERPEFTFSSTFFIKNFYSIFFLITFFKIQTFLTGNYEQIMLIWDTNKKVFVLIIHICWFVYHLEVKMNNNVKGKLHVTVTWLVHAHEQC